MNSPPPFGVPGSPSGSASGSSSGTTSHYHGGAPKYINDFTKALSGEVRMLLEEVGKLRDERRGLQQEIAELMAMKSKHGLGGEYSSWGASVPEPSYPQTMPSPSPPPETFLPNEPKPAWRVVHKSPQAPRAIAASTSTSAQASHPSRVIPSPLTIPPDPTAPRAPSWASWRPNPLYRLPTPPVAPIPHMAAPPPRDGLFGPSTPPP